MRDTARVPARPLGHDGAGGSPRHGMPGPRGEAFARQAGGGTPPAPVLRRGIAASVLAGRHLPLLPGGGDGRGKCRRSALGHVCYVGRLVCAQADGAPGEQPGRAAPGGHCGGGTADAYARGRAFLECASYARVPRGAAAQGLASAGLRLGRFREGGSHKRGGVLFRLQGAACPEACAPRGGMSEDRLRQALYDFRRCRAFGQRARFRRVLPSMAVQLAHGRAAVHDDHGERRLGRQRGAGELSRGMHPGSGCFT